MIHLKTAFVNALKTVWEVMCGLSGLALLASLVLKGYACFGTGFPKALAYP
jgi:hypothetical protein